MNNQMGYDEFAAVYHGGMIMALLWYLVISIPFAIGFYVVARRMGRSGPAWAILTLIPVVNWFFAIYASFTVVIYVLDRLNAIAPRAGAAAPATPPPGPGPGTAAPA